MSDELSLLGVVHPLDPCRPRRLKKLSMDKVQLRFKYIAAASSTASQVARHVRALAFTQMKWAAAFALLTDEQVTLRSSFRRNFAPEMPALLFNEVFDWWINPSFVLDWATLQAIIRHRIRTPLWMEEDNLASSLTPWWMLFPTALPLLRRLGWSPSPAGDAIVRQDQWGQARSFKLGRDADVAEVLLPQVIAGTLGPGRPLQPS